MSAARIASAAAVALGLWLGSVLAAAAELYPARPIKIIVPTPAGVGRQHLSDRMS